MKKIFFIFLCSFVVFACGKKEDSGKEESTGKDERVEITPLIINSVILRDTAMLKNIYARADSGQMKMFQYEDYFNTAGKYLNPQQFVQLKLSIQALIRNPKSQVYLDWNSKPLTQQEVSDRVNKCDSVQESSFDAQGNEIITVRWMCDSTSIYYQINRILFYESMYYNKNNNMIEKDLLGYSIQQYVEDKDAYKTTFMVFKDEKCLEKVKANYKD